MSDESLLPLFLSLAQVSLHSAEPSQVAAVVGFASSQGARQLECPLCILPGLGATCAAFADPTSELLSKFPKGGYIGADIGDYYGGHSGGY